MRILFLSLATIIALAAVSALVIARGDGQEAPISSPALTFQEKDIAEELSILLSQTDDEKNTQRVLLCEERRCEPLPWPRILSSDSVTDGQTWYSYQNDNLVKHAAAGSQAETIVTKNPLVAPRDMFLSPDGEKLAYFLDNVHEEKKELTELWLYEEGPPEGEARPGRGGTRLLVENIVRPDALTPPRWNSAGTHLWYIADSGKKDEKKIEFIVVGVQPPAATARFSKIQWPLHEEAARAGAMDISFTGRSVAFAEEISGGRTQLTVAHEGSEPQAAIVRGEIPFVQWQENGNLLYAVAETSGNAAFSFWQLKSTVHRFLARLEGNFISARTEPSGEYVAVVDRNSNQLTLSTIHLPSGASEAVTPIPPFGESTQIVHLLRQPQEKTTTPANREISTPLADAELAAFVEQHLPEVTGDATAKPLRLITTGEANVVFVDYRGGSGERRLLLTVRDAIHPEWSIRARYEPAGGEWRKIQGGGLADPAPKNVYEWEKDLNQWILKSHE